MRAASFILLFALASCGPRGGEQPDRRTCARALCGNPSEVASWTCGDGTEAGPTGRCLADEFGACEWEVRTCPNEPPPCVRGGCDGQLCIEAGQTVLHPCDYANRLDCEWRGLCERQEDGGCGFTETDEVRSCKTHGPQS